MMSALLAIKELLLTVIKHVRQALKMMVYSVVKLNTEEEEDIHGNSVIGLMMMEWLADVMLLME